MSVAQRKTRSKNRPMIIVIMVAILVIAFFVIRGCGGESTAETDYEFGDVEVRDVRDSVSALGTIQPWRVVDIKSNVAGRLDYLGVDLGDRVRENDLIALIDPTDPQAAVIQANSNLTTAQVRETQARINSNIQPVITDLTIEQASANYRSAQKNVEQSRKSKSQMEQQLATLKEVTIPREVEDTRNDLRQAEANLESARAEYNRQIQLLEKGYTSQSEVDAASARVATLEAAANTARQRQNTLSRQHELSIQTLETQLEQAETAIEEAIARQQQSRAALELAERNRYQDTLVREDLKASQAQINSSRAQLEQATTTLGYTRILAPRDGVVITRNVEEGTVVPSSRGSIGSTDALLQIGDISRLWVVCNVDETDIAKVSVGQRVNVTVDAYHTIPVRGTVIRIDPQAKIEQNVTTIPVTVELDEPDDRFKPGMNAECEFIVGEVKDAIAVPNDALVERQGKFIVQKLVNDKMVDIDVEIGVQGPEYTEIKSGLSEGETVITRVIAVDAQGPVNPLAPPGPGGRRGR